MPTPRTRSLLIAAAAGILVLASARLGPARDHYLPPRYIQNGHTTPWTYPAPSTKTASPNLDPAGQPYPTSLLVDCNVDYVVYRIKDVNRRSGGNVCCLDNPWTQDIVLTYAVESPHLVIGVDIELFDINPQNFATSVPLVPVGATARGLVYQSVLRAGDSDLQFWLAFQGWVSPPTLAPLHVVDVRLIGAQDLQTPPVLLGAGWNASARFVYEGPDPRLALVPVDDPGSGNVVHLDHVQATAKVPNMGVEVVGEGDGRGLGPGGANQYLGHKVVLRDANVELNPGTWRIGGNEASYAAPLTITLHQGRSLGAYAAAIPGEDFELVDATGALLVPNGTVPESWTLEVPTGLSDALFGLRVLREQPALDEGGWEELILVLGAPGGGPGTSLPPGYPALPPAIGWKDRMRFLIEDGQ